MPIHSVVSQLGIRRLHLIRYWTQSPVVILSNTGLYGVQRHITHTMAYNVTQRLTRPTTPYNGL